MTNYRKFVNPLEEYLKEVHAKQYVGTDDNMSDDFNNWFELLSAEEITKHANDLIDLVVDEMKEGFDVDTARV